MCNDAVVFRKLLPVAHHLRPPAEDQACREALLAAVGRFRRRVDAELPGMYAWFDDASLHITLRALIN